MDYHLFYSIEEVTFKNEDEVKQDIYDLWQECFGDSDSYTDFYFDWKIEYNQVLLIYTWKGQGRLRRGQPQLTSIKAQEAELVAMVHLNPYTLMVKDKEELANYIVGVATKKTHRRKGLMAWLLEASMGQMYKEEMPFTYLMPAEEGIYLPFDFRIVYNQDLWNDKLIQLKESLDKVEKRLQLRVLEVDNTRRLDELVSFTNKLLANKYDVYVKRTAYYYKRLINEMRSSGGQILLWYEQGQLIGYIAYMAESHIYIAEYIAYEDAEETMLKEFYKYSSSSHKMDIFKRKEGSQQTAIMARIVNLKACLSRLTSRVPLSVVLQVTDPIIKGNQGSFLVNIDEKGTIIEETNQPADLSITIADLTKLLFAKLENDKLNKIWLKSYETSYVRAADIEDVEDKTGETGKSILTTKDKLAKINTIRSVFINDIV